MFRRQLVMLDTNVYGRLFDSMGSEEVLEEALASYHIFALAGAGSVGVLVSDVLFAEVGLIKDAGKRKAVLGIVAGFSSVRASLNPGVVAAADLIHTLVRDYMDCLHVAFAAVNGCCLVTCDKELQAKSISIERLLSSHSLSVSIRSPVAFLAEVDENE